MYCVSKTQINKRDFPELHKYLTECCTLSKNLYNASLFRIRQNHTAQGKETLTDNEKEVREEILKTVKAADQKMPKYRLSYNFLEKLMRVTENKDFFAGLPMQSAQATVKMACTDFKSWLAGLREYKTNPSAFTGKPEMPGYKQSSVAMVKFTNQDCVLRNGVLKFPKTKETIKLPHITDNCVLKEVEVKPYYNDFLIITTYDDKAQHRLSEDMPYSCGIDFGVNNLASVVSNDGSCLLYKGGAVKAANQWFNKQRAKYTSILDKEGKPRTSKRLDSASRNRDNFLTDFMHKVSSDFIKYCLEHKIGTIVFGKNEGWKQNVNIGKKNNQEFVSIPFNKLQQMIEYKAKRDGIVVLKQEESYTSKASFLDNDHIPTYKSEANVKYKFSGRRISRGLYKSSNGTVINSDLNGAANILRKAIPYAFDGVTDFTFLQNPTVKNVVELYPQHK